ncbi:bifunctional transcriptional activator/DNA repair enzyme AdaA [Sandarakinorhabdus rubra]|uniref:bifunctional transcriptional activator/DNA repair enzyme AdaA n=1 Tax=Sandarakinorhabdus rubra TaxID=2672568 RepID=UPI0013D919DB|nr:Ada metal-binding domain-containing protein [Sandarakinorhabdus rubra]
MHAPVPPLVNGLDFAAMDAARLRRDPAYDGIFFIAVKTTGIYCRPVCRVRQPLTRNISFFPSAAAAERAGYRPCLRCRPESAPFCPAWNGTRTTVERALKLIDGGALDGDGTVDALAARCGVGARHLARLFREHLGASPIEVAQTRRVQRAMQMIAGSQLPMTEIALAAGFASLRRFNEVIAARYGRPPSALRAVRPHLTAPASSH